MAGWAIVLAGFALWTIFAWSLGRAMGYHRGRMTGFNMGWERRQKLESYIDRNLEDELQMIVGQVEHGE